MSNADKPWKNPHTGGVSSMADVVHISMTRDQLGAYHRALSCAIDHAEKARGNQDKVSFLATLVELSDAAMVAIWECDKLPENERDQGVLSRRANKKAAGQKR